MHFIKRLRKRLHVFASEKTSMQAFKTVQAFKSTHTWTRPRGMHTHEIVEMVGSRRLQTPICLHANDHTKGRGIKKVAKAP
jgi:hypothetical protein